MRVTVGICTCERDHLLRELLERLAAIELGPLAAQAVEILVVDNRPNDATRAICDEAARRLSVRLRYVAEPERGISPARNRAVAEALGSSAEALAFIDDDDLPEPDWLLRLVERWQETGADIVMGNRTFLVPETTGAIRARMRQRRLTEAMPTWKKNGLPDNLSTCNVLIGRRILERLSADGPVFDLAFAFMGGGDSDFFCRARRAGASFARAERSFISYRFSAERSTLKGLLRRKYKGGFVQGLLARRYMESRPRRAWLADAGLKLVCGVLEAPFDVFSRKRAGKGVSKIAWAIGALHGFAGGRFDYYAPVGEISHGRR